MNTNGNAPETKSLLVQKVNSLQLAVNEDFVQTQLKAALADNSGPFTASLIELFSGDKNLQECDPKLVIMQALKAAALKLPINKSLGFGYIVAYKGIPEFQIGYRGLYQLALRTKEYRIIHCDVVYEGEYKTKNKLTGEFDLSGEAKSDTVIGYFAYFEMKDGFSKTLFMTKEAVQKHAAKYSKSYNSQYSPWKTEFDAMAKKTVLRNLLSHYGKLSVDVANVLDKDDVAEEVQADINNNANKKGVQFEEADVIPQQQTNNASVANQPAF
jgi:recombination protein RecT